MSTMYSNETGGELVPTNVVPIDGHTPPNPSPMTMQPTATPAPPVLAARLQPLPTFTLSEALRGRMIDKDTYRVVQPLHKLSISHLAVGGVEPPEQVTHQLVVHYTAPMVAQLDKLCHRLLDRPITSIEGKTDQIDTNKDVLIAWNKRIRGAESNTSYSEPDAVTKVEALQEMMAAAALWGLRHHRRVGPVLRWAGKGAVYLEALGIAVFAMYALNVDPLDPMSNPFGWTLALVMVIVVLFGQPKFVERAAEGWNARREAINEQLPAAALESATRQVVTNGIVAGLFGMFITGGLVERYLAVADPTDQMVHVLMIFACVLTGIGMPLLDFVATAWDGSTTSREKDSLAGQLTINKNQYDGLRAGANALDQQCGTTNDQIRDHIVPGLHRVVLDTAGQAHKAYAWLRIQIGGLPAKPPVDAEPAINIDDASHPVLNVGIPGAPDVPLTPLGARTGRLTNLNTRRTDAITIINQLPAHPWNTTNQSEAGQDDPKEPTS